ncbi:MAG: hypothetical protein Q7V62_15360 [Actinomycetota bacterium]|nr:hypothetical protein [Actinomycetota bacterium]
MSEHRTALAGATFHFAAIARFKHSQHLDNDPLIGKLIAANRHTFETFVEGINAQLAEMGAQDSPELSLAIQHIEQAKDALGRAIIHHIGKVNGVPFEQAVRASIK